MRGATPNPEPATPASDSDQAQVDAMLTPFDGLTFDTVPPDPRRIDAARIRTLRERLVSPYSYTWRGSRANLDIALALFDGREGHRGTLIRLTHAFHADDEERAGPPVARSPIDGEPEACRRRYYITVAISYVEDYIGDLRSAETLMRSMLPGWGYTMTYGSAGRRLRLERGAEHGGWSTLEPPARALVAAILERVEAHPDEAPPWRGA
ncbi:hypothetical protein Q8W71_13490 [Methylobacterium sp. NEAU 140]|uniref:hypothetical protein n=1 Tax=Methylobacterium sp. NEAU 140 TaxID=3064945 RepID=UPI0027339C54|nr:hypothetical protein [Methylobacterium sp. NEAU 140]MDP4023647.1 hypothetical protein [Methylobacterium sp. NEAU 140]